jgi:hypothetical protein
MTRQPCAFCGDALYPTHRRWHYELFHPGIPVLPVEVERQMMQAYFASYRGGCGKDYVALGELVEVLDK